MTGEAYRALLNATRLAREAQACLAPFHPSLASEVALVEARLDAAALHAAPAAAGVPR
jgi:hypothetical protein